MVLLQKIKLSLNEDSHDNMTKMHSDAYYIKDD
jgi:hypothetical protein